ncbi:MAG: rod shape-determining protein MreD [Faecalibacterium sp.]|jgi:rod shape-determining protein MreD|nr:rod shape-determining protein MreD [Faecalibacterium sp.]
MESRRRRIRTTTVRWLLYSLTLLCAAALQTMPGFLRIGECKPYFVLGIALAVAVYEGEFYGALFGAVCGLLWDYLGGRTAGMLALGMMILCFFSSVIVQLYLKPSSVNFFLMNAGAGLILMSTDFLFFYLMRGYAAPLRRYFIVVVPEVLISAALAVPVLYLIRRIADRFTLLD